MINAELIEASRVFRKATVNQLGRNRHCDKLFKVFLFDENRPYSRILICLAFGFVGGARTAVDGKTMRRILGSGLIVKT